MASKTFAKRLKEERQILGWTQKEMAEKLGIPHNTYKNYESNGLRHCEPDLDLVVKIADVLQTSIDYLVGRE